MALISLHGQPLPRRGPRRSGTHFWSLLLKLRRIPIVFVFFASIENDWRPCFCAVGLRWLSTFLPCLASAGQLLTQFLWQPDSDESFNLTLLKAERFQLSTGHDSEAFFLPLLLFPHELTACWATSLKSAVFLSVWKPKPEHYSAVIAPVVDRVLAGPRPLYIQASRCVVID